MSEKEKRIKSRDYEQDRGTESSSAAEKPKASKLDKIPPIVKALFVKFWFGGMLFFFIGMGLFSLISADQFDLVLVLGLAFGVVLDIGINRLLLVLDSDSGKMKPHILFYSKKFLSLPLNIVYGVLLVFLVSVTYGLINMVMFSGKTVLAAEPILYGLFLTLYDTIFVFLKMLVLKIYAKIKNR